MTLVMLAFHHGLYTILSMMQLLFWRLNGTHNHLKAINEGHEYRRSAQLLRIWSRFQESQGLIVHYRRHFISTHAGFVHPDFALQTHVTLMTVTDKEAIFCVFNKHVNVFNTRKHPFLFNTLFMEAKYLLVMPNTSFIKLAEAQGDPKSKVIWLHHTGRCGSTAIAQAFNALPDTVALSVPHCLFALRQTYKYKHLFTSVDWQRSEEYRTIYRSAVRLLLKPTISESAEFMVVKAVPLNSIAEAELLYDMFPDFSQIFTYRDAAPQIMSMFRFVSGHDIIFDISKLVANNRLLSWMFPTVQPQWLIYNVCDEMRHVKI